MYKHLTSIYFCIAVCRYKTGIFGWGSDKSEKISGFDCKVFSASNFKLVTKIRTEHLSETEKSAAESKSKLERLLETFGSSSSDGSSSRHNVSQLELRYLVEIGSN